MPYKDKEKQKEAQKKHYQENKVEFSKRQLKRRQINREYILEYKNSHHCECGESHVACLDFHHLNKDEKKDRVSKIASNGTIKSLIEEIEKCVVLCSNCHRKLHYEDGLYEETSKREKKNL